MTRATTEPVRVDVAAAIRDYATLCRDELPADVHVRSYAGLWLLLAVLGPVVSDATDRSELEAALGMDVASAAEAARRLMAEHREGLGTATAGWLREGLELLGPLPVRLDPLPTQSELDRWAREATHGLVPRFPVELVPDTVLLLASALSVRTEWHEPLDGTPDDRLRIGDDGTVAVVATRSAGLVAVAAPEGRGDLDVLSVIADPDVIQSRVWAATDEVTAWLLDGSLAARRVPAAELERDGHAWTVKRTTWAMPSESTATEVWQASVPAWTLESTTDLANAPGIAATTRAVLDLVPQEPKWAEAVQSANATYGAKGFEAVAVTVLDFMAGSAAPPVRKVHVVHLTFDRPHAVLALTRGGAWDGVPVVHAWINGSSDPELARPGGIDWQPGGRGDR